MGWQQYHIPQQQPYYAVPAPPAAPQQFVSSPPQTFQSPRQAMPIANYSARANTVAAQRFVNSASQAYQAPRQAMPNASYQAPAPQPYYVASRAIAAPPSPMGQEQIMAPNPAMMPSPQAMQNQYPVTPSAAGSYYQGAPQPQYNNPADQWADPTYQGNVGYCTDNYGGGYGADSCCGSSYCADACCCAPCKQWFGSVGAMVLTRDDENHRFYSYDSANEALQLLDSQDSNFSSAGGVAASVGCMDMCSCTGCEFVYWGLYPDTNYAYAYPSQVTGDLNGIFNFDQLDYNGQTADNFVNGAAVHRLSRDTEIHNVEFNRIWNCGGCCGTSCCTTGCNPCYDSCCANGGRCGLGGRGCFGGHGCGGGCCGGPWTFGVLTGFRYLRFEDNISFASDPNDTVFTGEADELYYNIDCDNDLWGWQFGGFGQKALGVSGLSLVFGAKAGVFLNDADARSTIGGSAGLATINNGPNQGVAWDIESSDDCLATIAELQAGMAWAFCPTWRVRCDYRLIGISGVALPTNQIYQDLRGIQDVSLISTNGDLILHGVFAGLERTY